MFVFYFAASCLAHPADLQDRSSAQERAIDAKTPSRPIRSPYDLLLEALAHDSDSVKIARLEKFVRDNPAEERAYLKLLEQYQWQQKHSAALAFFRGLPDSASMRRNRNWMLAKLASCDTLRQAARDALDRFAAALRDNTTPPSPALLYDFVVFWHENSEHLGEKKELTEYLLRAEAKRFADAIYMYLDEEYPHAVAALQQIPQAMRNSPLALYVLSDCILRNERKASTIRYAIADSVALKALESAESNNDREWQSRFVALLGDIAFERQSDTQAQARYEQAYSLAHATCDLLSRQKALTGMGKIKHVQRLFNKADSLYQTALPIAERICAHRDVSLIYSNQCQALIELGRFAQALQAGELSRRAALRAHDEVGLVRIQLKLARIHFDLRQTEFARKMCLDARALAERRGYRRFFNRATSQLADILARERKFDDARKLYDANLKNLDGSGNSMGRHGYLAKKADTYKEEGPQHYAEAIALYQRASEEAKAEGDAYYHAWYLLEIADLEIKHGRLSQAKAALEAVAPDILRGSEEGFIRLKLISGEYWQKREAWARAIAAYREAAAVIDTMRPHLEIDHLRIGYFSDRTRAAQGLAECYYRQYQMHQVAADRDSLFYFMEMAKGRSFHDRDAGISALNDSLKIDPQVKQNYLRESAALRKLQRRLRFAPTEYDTLRPRLEAARYSVIYQRPQMQASNSDTAPKPNTGFYTLAEAQSYLQKSQAALLLYHISESAAFVLVITATEARTLPVRATRAQLSTICDSLMAPFHAESINPESLNSIHFRAAKAHLLYELALKPVEDAVTLPRQLIIVPDGALINVPFEMFLSAAPTQEVFTPKDSAIYAKDFLLRRYSFVYSPSFGLLKKNLRMPSPKQGVLIIANPDARMLVPMRYDGVRSWVWKPLPFTELEAERIAKIVAHADKYTRAQATKTAFFEKKSQHRALHLATHAFVDSAFDAFSGLVLALSADSLDDGLLMGYEIADRKLSYDLVSLSACETGRGNLVEGEGTLGLPRLFLRAGAKSVLMTLWQVDDRFAAELVPRLYDYSFNRGHSKVEALAAAKRDLMLNPTNVNGIYHQHPFYWAAFTLYGDPGQNETPVITFKRALLIFAVVFSLLTLLSYLRFRTIKHAKARA